MDDTSNDGVLLMQTTSELLFASDASIDNVE